MNYGVSLWWLTAVEVEAPTAAAAVHHLDPSSTAARQYGPVVPMNGYRPLWTDRIGRATDNCFLRCSADLCVRDSMEAVT